MHRTVLAAVLTLIAAGPHAAIAASELRVGFTEDALTLDPANHRKRETETIIRNIYDGLLTRDSRMNVVPELAESWRQIDPLTYEFTLRGGVKFHSGDEMTADDVKFTFHRLIDTGALCGQTSPRKSLLGPLKEVEITAPLTVRFHLSEPWPILPAMLPFQEIVSRKFAEAVGCDGMATRENGTGPFKLVDWRRGDSVILERFADYYGGSPDIPPPGPARVDRVIFKIIPENSSRVAALLAGDVDIINELPVSAIRDVEASAGAQVMKVNGTRTYFVALNVTKPPFDKPAVRQALNYAVDKKLIVDKILNGTATVLSGVLSPDAFAFDADLPPYAYDPAKAKQLLAEAGYPNGIDATLDAEAAFKDQAEAVAALLNRAGVRAKVRIWEGAVLTPIWQDAQKRRDRDMVLAGWGNGSLDPSDIMMPTIRSGGRGNLAGYANPEVDRMLDSADVEVDRAKRHDLYIKIQETVNREAPWIFLWLPQEIYGVSKRVRGWQPSADSRINLHRASVD